VTRASAFILRDVQVVDPYKHYVGREDVAVSDGHFVAERPRGAPVVSARGLWLVPRIVDLHVHLRDPGQTEKEDLSTGLRAAAAGGVTVVGVMPNTVPVTDAPEAIIRLRERAAALDLADVWPIGAVTRGSQGLEPAPWAAMGRAGALAFSDDGRPVHRADIVAEFLQQQGAAAPLIQHLEVPELARGGVAHAGAPAALLGLPGMPAAAEAVMAWRDVALVREVGGRLHLAHCSVPGTLDALMWARRHGLAVTGEATPHHLWFTDEALREWHGSAVTKVNPPLRPARMREALRRAVVTGLISVVASDHAPHRIEEKARPYEEAPFGISGLETLLGVLLTLFLGVMDPLTLMARVTVGPHRVVGATGLGVVPGAAADFTLVDPTVRWRVDPARFQSKGRNTPFDGVWLTGRPVATVRRGRFVYQEGTVSDDGHGQD
jgi:dihydroorotase